MLHQHQVTRQHVSELVDGGNGSESSVDGRLQPVSVHSAGAASVLRNLDWYDPACLFW